MTPSLEASVPCAMSVSARLRELAAGELVSSGEHPGQSVGKKDGSRKLHCRERGVPSCRRIRPSFTWTVAER